MPVYKISIQFTNPFKRYRTETIFQGWKFFKVEKGRNSQSNWWILPQIELDLHCMIIHLCIKFQSNIPILSKDIAWKPFVLRTGRTGRTNVRTAVILYAPLPHPTENGGDIKTVGIIHNFYVCPTLKLCRANIGPTLAQRCTKGGRQQNSIFGLETKTVHQWKL